MISSNGENDNLSTIPQIDMRQKGDGGVQIGNIADGGIVNLNFGFSTARNRVLDNKSVVIVTQTRPLQPSDFFRGRNNKMEEVKRLLIGDAKLMILNGMGGIGKTEFCRKLFHECINERLPEVKKVGWLVFHENIEQTFFHQFTELSFQTDSPAEYFIQATRYLDSQKGDLLLFIDNANELSERDAALLSQLWCKVVLTSRRRSLERLQAIEIGKLAIEDCRILYRQHSEEYPYNADYNYGVIYAEDDSPNEDLDAIIEMADRHTLAIELLAKTQKSAAYSTRKMRETLIKTGFSLSAISESITYIHTPEVGKWDKAEQIFIEQFSKVLDISNIKNEKLRVLQLFSLLSADTITAENVRNWFEVDDLDMVNALVSQGWVFRNRIGGQLDVVFSIHPLITSVVRHKALPRFETAAPLAIGLSEALDFDDTDLFTDRLPNLNHAISFVEAINEGYDEYLALINCIVVMLNQMAEYDKSLILLEKAKNFCETVGDADPLVTSTVYHNLAYSYLKQSKFEQAKEWCQKAIALRENNPETEKSQLANSYDCLGNIYEMLGEYQETLHFLKKSLDLRKSVFGANSPQAAISYINLGCFYSSLGNFKQALKYGKMALSIQESTLDEKHPDLATTYNNVGLEYNNLGKPDMAMKYYSKALFLGEAVYGSEHPDVLITLDNIADTYVEMGEYKKAEDQYSAILETRIKVLGENHYDTAKSYQCLGIVCYYQSQFGKALNMFNKALEIDTLLLGERNPDVAAIIKHIADVYSDMEGMMSEALNMYEKVLDIQLEAFGKKHPHVAVTYSSMGILYAEIDDHEKAMQCYKNALRIQENTVGRKHAHTSTTIYNIGRLYEDTGEIQKALDCFFEAYNIVKDIYGKDSPDVAEIGDGIAHTYDRLGNFPQANEWFENSIRLYEKYFGNTNLRLSITYHNYADSLERQGRYNEALRAFKRAYEIETTFYEPIHETVKITMSRIDALKNKIGGSTNGEGQQ